ncbi:MAG: BlaI/MecI/CopY family transcriptional regulator [Acetatifactor sp.]|nr:BlaI/MecI/CopY family transcriptional regulator [Acetatifactor sp.]
MEEKLFDSELKVMNILWEKGTISAKDLSLIMADLIGWNKNTTYTIVKKLIQKGYIRRDDPGFLCTALITQNEVQKKETSSLLDKFFKGSRKALFSALLEDESMGEEELKELRNLIEQKR